MRVNKRGFLFKVACVIRFLFTKLYYVSSFNFTGLGMIGARCYFFIENTGSITFGKKVIVGDMVEIQSSGVLNIGSNCVLNRYSRIVCFDNIEIGNNVAIAQFVSILDHDHNYEIINDSLLLDGYNNSPIKIGNNVWIGDKSTILRGATIGDNVIIAAHTLVNKDIPSNSVVAGTPCKIIKTLQ